MCYQFDNSAKTTSFVDAFTSTTRDQLPQHDSVLTPPPKSTPPGAIAKMAPYRFIMRPIPVEHEAQVRKKTSAVVKQYRRYGKRNQGKRDRHGRLNDPEVLQTLHEFVLRDFHSHSHDSPEATGSVLAHDHQTRPLELLKSRYGLPTLYQQPGPDRERYLATGPFVDIYFKDQRIIQKVSFDMLLAFEPSAPFFSLLRKSGANADSSTPYVFALISKLSYLPVTVLIVVGWMEYECLCGPTTHSGGCKAFIESINPTGCVLLAYRLYRTFQVLGFDTQAKTIEEGFEAWIADKRVLRKYAKLVWVEERRNPSSRFVRGVAKCLARTAYREADEGLGVDLPIDFGRNYHVAAMLNEKGNEALKALVVESNPALLGGSGQGRLEERHGGTGFDQGDEGEAWPQRLVQLGRRNWRLAAPEALRGPRRVKPDLRKTLLKVRVRDWPRRILKSLDLKVERAPRME
ncbi:uncharacterized protein BDZ99DRAFT_501918 [Mytilinidion resinicola]|uniref:Uncharacterized protein n=1 Tax=Mytilinidion resinicola TaxID=574789 RepID=A0A6A6YA79_9PEZI|nr:uncharacterized protein BDZ99DRAFT_501918 [Mytilinidion resinicola]KAF2805025.1 hypothetical protein BDZ99DRAFT_501918 [Mytilinidion resinicola]